MLGAFMSTAASLHLARASKAARLLKDATSQEEAALLMDAGMSELNAALVAAPKAIAERVQQMVNEIARQMMSVVNEDILVDALESAQT
jgi:CelD/BcsL family acetyltransferase involved in cellulose biosynthesis